MGHMSPSPFLTSDYSQSTSSSWQCWACWESRPRVLTAFPPVRREDPGPGSSPGSVNSEGMSLYRGHRGISSQHWGRLGEGVLTGITLVCITRASKLLSKTCLLFN